MKNQNVINKYPVEDHDAENTASSCALFMKKHPRLDEFFEEISQQSSAHGVKYIGSKKLQPVERLFWTLVMLISLGFSISLAYNVFKKYNDSPVIISFRSKEISVAQVPFPAISICGVNLLKRSVLDKTYSYVLELLSEYRESKEVNETQENMLMEHIVHMDHLSQYCLSARSYRRYFNETLLDARGNPDFVESIEEVIASFNESINEKFSQVEHNNTKWWEKQREIFRNATIHCEDLILKCMWAESMIPCKEIFFHITTRHGRCCVFNMMPKFILQNISEEENRAKMEMKGLPDDAIKEWKEYGHEDLVQFDRDKVANINYPKHQKAGGKLYGLTVLVNPDLKEYSTCTANDGWGFKIVAHSPLSSPSIMEYGAAIAPNSEVYVEVEPHVTIAEKGVLDGIDLDKRGCLLADESLALLKYYNFYSTENCFAECVALETFRNCSCVRYFMPRNASQALCRAKQHKCADDVRSNISKTFGKNSFCGHCQAPCTDIMYKLQMSQFDIRDDIASSIHTYTNWKGELTNATNYSIIHFYMGSDSLYVKERKTLFDEFDLIANAGGLLSLTLGVSIISFVEIVYLCTVRVWFKSRSLSKDKTDKSNDIGTGKISTSTMSRKTKSITIMGKEYHGYYK